MNKNCPHMKINLEMGFLNLNKCNMTWHKMMNKSNKNNKHRERNKLTIMKDQFRRHGKGQGDVETLMEEVFNINLKELSTRRLIYREDQHARGIVVP